MHQQRSAFVLDIQSFFTTHGIEPLKQVAAYLAYIARVYDPLLIDRKTFAYVAERKIEIVRALDLMFTLAVGMFTCVFELSSDANVRN